MNVSIFLFSNVLVACSYLRQGMMTKRSTHENSHSFLASVNKSLVMSIPSHLGLFKLVCMYIKRHYLKLFISELTFHLFCLTVLIPTSSSIVIGTVKKRCTMIQ